MAPDPERETDMALSGPVVRAALAAVGAVGKQIRTFDELAAGADDALRQAPPGLTPAGAAAFLATCAVESAWFRTTEEYGGAKARYAPFYGRTFVQLTWQENYAGFGAWCHAKGLVSDPQVFVKNPAALSDFRWAWLGAVYYFESHGIWRWANAGEFRAVSQAVNGGNGRVGTAFTPNGWAERQAMYRVFLGVGAALIPAPTPTEDPMAWRMARALDQFLKQINALAPNRSKVSDGGIGDPRHQANPSSDHNAHYVVAGIGVVTARDATHDPAGGLDCNKLAAALVESRDFRIEYIIWDERFISSKPGPNQWRWVPYTGDNPHTKHLHLSIWDNPSCDDTRPWALPGMTDEEDVMTPAQEARLARVERAMEIVVQQVCGERATIEEPFPGEAKGGGWMCSDGKRRTLVDIGRRALEKFTV